jgi:hypothetical protein
MAKKKVVLNESAKLAKEQKKFAKAQKEPVWLHHNSDKVLVEIRPLPLGETGYYQLEDGKYYHYIKGQGLTRCKKVVVED